MDYSIIVPVYNEELVAEETHKRLNEVMDGVGGEYEIIFINDGSRDRTAEIVSGICEKDKNCRMIDFSRNFGHQIAITAGMDYSSGDAVVVIDADLQDPPELIPKMIEKWREGYHVVYAKRDVRQGETAFKKVTAKLFYRILGSMTEVPIPVDVGDFRLIDRKVCDTLSSLTEKNRYVRGLVSWIGFNQCAVSYERHERFAGETKYPLKKMIKFALDGITSFSQKPLRLASYLGFSVSILSFVYLCVVLIQKIFGVTIEGWASMTAVSLFFNGIVLIMLGIIGEYIGRIYDETKGRPLYIVKEAKGFDNNK